VVGRIIWDQEMGTLIEANSNARELVTEILDETTWWSTLRVLVALLDAKHVVKVRAEFGFVLDRNLAGKQQVLDHIVELKDLEPFIKTGLEEGTIEWNRSSDFRFYPLGLDLAFMLCNDADLHFAAVDAELLSEFAQRLREGGVKVFDSGKLT
jgi:hypothetical protein